MLNPGTFDHKISFTAPSTTKSAMGAPSKIFVHSFYIWMSREQMPQGQEQYINSRLVVPNRYIYRGHYNSAVNETLQMVESNQGNQSGQIKYNILSVNPLERNMFIEIVAEKIIE